MKKLISFCLYGDDSSYIDGAILNAKASKLVFKDWELRFYISDEIQNSLENELQSLGCKTIRMKRKAFCDFMFYRFLPIQETYYDAVIIRDVDSILDERDEWTGKEWVKSECSFHIIRDHPNHMFYILGGLFGYRPKSKKINNLKDLLSKWNNFNEYGADQDFLASKIYPLVRDDAYIHSDLIAFGDEEIHPIVFKRNQLSWIGKRYLYEKESNEKLLKEKINLGIRRLPLVKYNLPVNKCNYLNSKFVVLKGVEGFCDRLQCLLQAIEYASQTGRILVVDWRDEHWSHNQSVKFCEYFYINGVKNIDIEDFLEFFNQNKNSLGVIPKAWKNEMNNFNFIEFMSNKNFRLNENQAILHEISNGCKADFEEEIVVYPGRGFRKSTYFLTNCLSLSKELKENILNFSSQKNLYYRSYDVIHLRGGSKKWLGGNVADYSPVKDLHNQWQNADEYIKAIWDIYKSLKSSLPLYLISDSSKLIEIWLKKYNCGLALPNLVSTKVRECGIHKLKPQDLLGINSPKKKDLNYECIRDFIIMLNSNFLIGDDVSYFSKVAFKIKKLGIVITKFPDKPSSFEF